ncbi:MAG: LiaF domain-containing protein, partial [Bacteroidota bacterium]
KKKDGWGCKGRWKKWKDDGIVQVTGPAIIHETTDNSTTGEEYIDTAEKLDATAIFGAVKKIIVSKNFRGGDATSIFGGSEIDLSKADINGTVKIDVTAILGGVKLIVPPHWTVRQDVTAIFGGVDDKRDTYNVVTAQNKVLILDGTAFMGGIEISSYR